MCGIFGYIGNKKAEGLCLEGLKKLEYRGYDSSGLAGIQDNKLILYKTQGKVAALEKILQDANPTFSSAIAHTRWATHGKPSLSNAHPHIDQHKTLAVVHNGIIENYNILREELLKKNILFSTETDTEVVAQHIGHIYQGDILMAALETFKKLEGSFAIALIHENHKEQIIATAKECPLLIAFSPSTKETFICSDTIGLPDLELDITYLIDREIALLEKDKKPVFFNQDGVLVVKKTEKHHFKDHSFSKKGYEHFMLKEIFEQASIVQNVITPHIDEENQTAYFENLTLKPEIIQEIENIVLIGCGTSYHAACLAAYFFESIAKIHAEAAIASEYRYREPIIQKNTLIIVLSQSGETADTIAAMRHVKDKAKLVIALCNVPNSTLAREADNTILMQAGPEIAVASTKTFTSQTILLYLLSIFFAKEKGMSLQERTLLLKQLYEIPEQIQEILSKADEIKAIAEKYAHFEDFFFLGRGPLFPTALEAALKLKEIAYINAQGYPAGEMKHGPIALLGKKVPVVLFCANQKLQVKMMNNLMESKARGSPIIVFGWKEFEKEILPETDHFFWIPKTSDHLACILLTIVTQLFSYYSAKERKTEIDQPQNLAKSVTVE